MTVQLTLCEASLLLVFVDRCGLDSVLKLDGLFSSRSFHLFMLHLCFLFCAVSKQLNVSVAVSSPV